MSCLELEQQSNTLRADLKVWENKWARAHKGAKPSKSDIKNNPDIGGWFVVRSPQLFSPLEV